MKNSSRADAPFPPRLARTLLACACALAASSCRRPPPDHYQGYLEGEFVYVGAPLPGRLDKLSVSKGSHIETGAQLFSLENASELAAQRQAASQLLSAQARLEDLKKGSRPSELAALSARLAQARATAVLSALEFTRQDELRKTHVISDNDFDRSRLALERNHAATAELEAQLTTAQLGSRPDTIAAAQAEVAATTAARERADWHVAQKSQASPRAAFVFDTLYHEGEFVAAGQPVVALLPPENLKVRFFAPEADLPALRIGRSVRVNIDGRPTPADARITYVSPRPEYTPPVLYNRENRARLVYLIEAVFPPDIARDLHPGQPVDVDIAAIP